MRSAPASAAARAVAQAGSFGSSSAASSTEPSSVCWKWRCWIGSPSRTSPAAPACGALVHRPDDLPVPDLAGLGHRQELEAVECVRVVAEVGLHHLGGLLLGLTGLLEDRGLLAVEVGGELGRPLLGLLRLLAMALQRGAQVVLASSSTSLSTLAVASWAAIARPSTSPILLSSAVSSAISPLLDSFAEGRLPDHLGAKPGCRYPHDRLTVVGLLRFALAAVLLGSAAAKLASGGRGRRALASYGLHGRRGGCLGGDDRARGGARDRRGRRSCRAPRRQRPSCSASSPCCSSPRSRAGVPVGRAGASGAARGSAGARQRARPARARVRRAAVPARGLALDRRLAGVGRGSRSRRCRAGRRVACVGPRARRAAAGGRPQAALSLDHEGPELGGRVGLIERFEGRPAEGGGLHVGRLFALRRAGAVVAVARRDPGSSCGVRRARGRRGLESLASPAAPTRS